MDLKELESGVDPKKHWYYQSKKRPLFYYFEKVYKQLNTPITLIDFGAGSGFFALELLEAYPDAIKQVLLIDIGYSEEEMAVTKGQKVEKLHFIPEGGISNGLVIMMDVLEHIEDDYAIMQDIKKRLEGSSNMHYFITVPAFQSLWSGHDVYLEHYRRYKIPMLGKLLNSAQCQISSQYYIYGWMFPLVWLIRKLKGSKNDEIPEQSDMKPTPQPINGLLKWINIFEMQFRKINKLFGVTCVAEGKIM